MDDNVRILKCELNGYKADGTAIYYMELAGPSVANAPTSYEGGVVCVMSLFFEDTGKVYNMTAAGTWQQLFDFAG